MAKIDEKDIFFTASTILYSLLKNDFKAAFSPLFLLATLKAFVMLSTLMNDILTSHPF